MTMKMREASLKDPIEVIEFKDDPIEVIGFKDDPMEVHGFKEKAEELCELVSRTNL